MSATLQDRYRKHAHDQAGYTLVEVLVTMVIMGMILLVVNVILISLVRVSYNTDTRINVRQGIEFALEVMRRNVKSSEPGQISLVTKDTEDPFPTMLRVKLAESNATVTFYAQDVCDGEDICGALSALWEIAGETSVVSLTSPSDLNILSFDPVVTNIAETGTSEILITVTASSTNIAHSGDPVVPLVSKQVTILTHTSEL